MAHLYLMGMVYYFMPKFYKVKILGFGFLSDFNKVFTITEDLNKLFNLNGWSLYLKVFLCIVRHQQNDISRYGINQIPLRMSYYYPQ